MFGLFHFPCCTLAVERLFDNIVEELGLVGAKGVATPADRVSIDKIRDLIEENSQSKKKVLLLFKDSYLLDKGINEQKALQKNGIVTILHLNPCNEISKASILMKEHDCTEIKWIK